MEAAEPTLDQRFTELRRAVDDELAGARCRLLEELTRALCRLRSASNEAEWSAAVAESMSTFPDDAAAREFLSMLAAVTAPASKVPQPAAELQAQRFARVKVAEIQLYHATEVKRARASRDLYGALRPHIDAAREAFRERFLTSGENIADYLHAELVKTLAHDDAEQLGPGYPGPMA